MKHKLYSILSDKNLVPHLGTMLPRTWIDIRNEIDRIRHSGVNFISIQKYYDICKKFNLKKRAALYLSDFLHDLGIILHFQDEIILNDIVILNHKWTTKGVYKVLDSKDIGRKNGLFDSDDLNKMWSSKEFRNSKAELLALMKKFEIFFELKNGKYIAPQLLPADEPDFNFDNICTIFQVKNSSLKLRYEYDFMPRGITTRLIVKLNKRILDDYYWKFGVIFKYEKTLALVVEDKLQNNIDIYIRGKEKREMLGIVRSAISEIHYSFKDLSYSEQVPCNCKGLPLEVKSYFFEVKDLKRGFDKGVLSIRCPRCFESHSIIALLEGVTPRKIYSVVSGLIVNGDIEGSLNVIENKIKLVADYEIMNSFILYSHQYRKAVDLYPKRLISKDIYDPEINRIIQLILKLAKNIDDKY